MKNTIFWTLLVQLTLANFLKAQINPDPVILITIDGLRPDAIEIEQPETLWNLIKNGNYFKHATTIDRSLTLPSHTSLLTGLDYTKHNVTWNSYQPDRGLVQFPTILELIKNEGYSTSMFVAKEKFLHLKRENSVDHFSLNNKGDGEDVAEAFDLYTRENGLTDMTFIHLPDPDASGHRYGWMTPAYIHAVNEADDALKQIIQIIEHFTQNYRLIITADHGGTFFEHLLPIFTNRRIPLIVTGTDIAVGELVRDSVKIYDVAATVLQLFFISPLENFDGTPLPLQMELSPQASLPKNLFSSI